MRALLLGPEAVLPDVKELLTEPINEVEEVTEEKDRDLVASSTHASLTFRLCLLICDLLNQILIAGHENRSIFHQACLKR